MPGWTKVKSDYSYGDDARSCRYANDGHYAVGSKDGYIRYYDSSYNQVWRNRRDSDSEIEGLAFSPNSSYLLATWTADSRKVAIFDVSSNTSEINLTSPNSDSDAADWSSDGTLFAFGNNDKDLFVNNGSSTSTFNNRL